MPSNIGAIAVNLLAKTRDFDRKIGFSKSLIKEFSFETKTLGKRMATGLRFGLAAAAGATVFFAKQQAKALDEVGKTSDKIGIGADKLQEFHLAAKLSGVTISTMNMGLQRMTRRISEASIGTGEAQAALRELNLSAKSLVMLDAASQYERIQKALGTVANESDKVRLASKLFDSEGVALINANSQALSQAAREYRTLGGAISSRDIDRIEAVNDELTKFGDAVKIGGGKLVVDASETLVDAIKGLRVVTDALGFTKTKTAVDLSREERDRQDRLRGRQPERRPLTFNDIRGGAAGLLGEFLNAVSPFEGGGAGQFTNARISGNGLTDAQRAAMRPNQQYREDIQRRYLREASQASPLNQLNPSVEP